MVAEANTSTQLTTSALPVVAPEDNSTDETVPEKTGALASLSNNSDVLRQVALILVLAITLAIGVFLMIWAQEPTYRPLGQMETQELIETLDFLDQQQLPYKIEGNVVSVPEEQFSEIRLQLTRNGLGSARAEQDFLSQDSGFGVSQRMEQARLKHSQEQTLALAVEELRSVQRARVILALPQQNVFARQQREPSATVVVTLAGGTELRQTEVDSIVDLVASAVHGLRPNKVTVTDQYGRLLNSGSQDGVSAQGRRELELRIQQEQLYREKIDSILIPVLGLGNYSAQVDVSMDFSAMEETTRRFNPEQVPGSVRSEMLINDNQSGNGAIGIPGALTNQPPLNSEIPEDVATLQQNQQVANGRSRSEITRNFEVDSTVSHVRAQIGTVRRVTLSVAINHQTVTNADNQSVQEARTEAELADIRRLLMGSVGFDPLRGDVLEVVSVPFATIPDLELGDLPIYEQEWFWRAVKLALGSLGLLVLLLVIVRPTVMRLLYPDQGKEDEQLGAMDDLADLEDQLGKDSLGLLTQNGEYGYAEDGSILLPDLHRDDEMLRAIRALVANEPDLSAQVIKSWLSEDD